MDSKNTNNHTNLIVQICLWGTVILWSSSLVAIRIGLHGYSPGGLAVLRYLVASVCLIFLYFRLPDRHLPNWRDLLSIVFIGVVGIGIYNVSINYGEVVVPAGIAGFIIGLMPVFTMFFALFLLKESVPIKCWIGVAISLLGLFLIAYHEKAEMKYYFGLLYVLIGAILGGYYAVAQKKLFHRYTPLELVILSIWGATLFMLIFLPDMVKQIPKAPWQATAAAIYLGIFPAAIAYALWNFALSKTPAGKASGYLYAMPIIATLLGMILLREYPEPIELTGGLITLAGAFIINYFYKKSIH
ncbi:MAG: EamA family transporter [Proteobacteria bacterium]|nr:EamA family transporter [Pseudomonadota bacterium]